MPSKTNKEIIDGKKTFSDFLTEKIKKIEGLKRKQKKHDGNRYYTIDELADFESDSFYQTISQVLSILK